MRDWNSAAIASLSSFVKTVCSSAIFRRTLRYRPAAALRQFGYEPERSSETLPVRHYEVSVSFTREVLFGHDDVTVADTALPFEVRLVLYGLKPMALAQASTRDAVALMRKCRAMGLFAILSPYEFKPISDTAAGGYVNVAGERTPATARTDTWRTVVIARDSHQVQLGWLALLFRWDEFLGLQLGYPACCASTFASHWKDACAAHDGEVAAVLVKRAASCESNVIEARHCCMNLFARYFGFHLTEHFPCSLQCVATAELGNRLLTGLAEFEPREAAHLQSMLSCPVVYAQGQGACLFLESEWDFDRATLRYSSTLMSDPLAPLLRRFTDSQEWHPRDGGVLMRFPLAAA